MSASKQSMGGTARANSMSPDERRAVASRAALTRGKAARILMLCRKLSARESFRSGMSHSIAMS